MTALTLIMQGNNINTGVIIIITQSKKFTSTKPLLVPVPL